MTCNECMKGSPYKFCCKLECGEHEFCRGCSYVNKTNSCCYKNEQMIQHSEELDNNSTEDYFNGKHINWSKARPLPPVTDGFDYYSIPVEKVIDDMYSDSYIASSAKDYYITNYATEQEKEEFRRQETISHFFIILSIIFLCCFVISLLILS